MWTENAILGIETTLEDVFGRYTGVAISIIKEEFPDALCIERRKLLSGGTRLGARVSRLYSLVKWLLLCYAELVPGKQSEVWSLLQSNQYCHQNLNTVAHLRLVPLLFEIFGISSTEFILPYQHTLGPSPFFTGSCIKKCDALLEHMQKMLLDNPNVDTVVQLQEKHLLRECIKHIMSWYKVFRTDDVIKDACHDIDKARSLLKEILKCNGFVMIPGKKLRVSGTTGDRLETMSVSSVLFDLKLCLCLSGRHRQDLLSAFGLMRDGNACREDREMIGRVLDEFERTCVEVGVEPNINIPTRKTIFRGYVPLTTRRHGELCVENAVSMRSRVHGLEGEWITKHLVTNLAASSDMLYPRTPCTCAFTMDQNRRTWTSVIFASPSIHCTSLKSLSISIRFTSISR